MTQPAVGDDLLHAGGDERRWRRRSLWALLVAIPATLILTGYEDLGDLAHGREWFGSAVAPGEAARYGGADWQLEEIQAVPERAGRMGMPASALPIRVRFRVTIREGWTGELWLPCRISLIDADGRRWRSMGFGGLPASSDTVKSCGGATLEPHQPGEVLAIEESFAVPKAQAGALEPTVSVAAERPWYLRFRRGP
ncbi:hypothetical protein FFK22_000310 [Mycobacterium sp. KBS0706]|uniref:hypothetical protein n=1 Tax=Mycobacterium sp. KBS0706 TaxID=2578109 RepID=UPI00110FC7AA|nr:hypothetical protein [Mycobacterium sp. KBS0706]TSD90681.1 hypothetical protein FFK22_000310 [Mycobacterium sp. KBS0706]